MSTWEERVQGLEVDIDTRIADLWSETWGGVLDTLSNEQREAFGAVVRAAYGKGYCDALREEKEGKRGELPLTHGYKVP